MRNPSERGTDGKIQSIATVFSEDCFENGGRASDHSCQAPADKPNLSEEAGARAKESANQERTDRFLKMANGGYQALTRVNQEAQSLAITDVIESHRAAAEATGKTYAAFNGNPALITEARELLMHQKELSELTVRQLKRFF